MLVGLADAIKTHNFWCKKSNKKFYSVACFLLCPICSVEWLFCTAFDQSLSYVPKRDYLGIV